MDRFGVLLGRDDECGSRIEDGGAVYEIIAPKVGGGELALLGAHRRVDVGGEVGLEQRELDGPLAAKRGEDLCGEVGKEHIGEAVDVVFVRAGKLDEEAIDGIAANDA